MAEGPVNNRGWAGEGSRFRLQGHADEPAGFALPLRSSPFRSGSEGRGGPGDGGGEQQQYDGHPPRHTSLSLRPDSFGRTASLRKSQLS